MDPRVAKATEIIKRDYYKKILLDHVADSVNLSPFYFHRLFKKNMGETFFDFLSRIRLDRAALLIRFNTSCTMSMIANDCGFSSLATFSRAFSQKFGLSPLKYLHQLRKIKGETEEKSGVNVNVEYHPEKWILYTPTYENDVDFAIDSSLAFAHNRGINNLTITKYSIHTHLSLDQSNWSGINYYAGVEIKTPMKEFHDRIYRIPEGMYCAIDTATKMVDIMDCLMAWNAQWLVHSKFSLRDNFFFRHLDESNREAANRIYVPIKSN